MSSITWQELRKKSKRESDYIITLFLTNEVSLLITWILLRTRITPNHVTVASILFGLGCALCYAFGNFIIGSLLLFISHVLDCTDGNIARAKEMFSPLGKWLDMFGDRLSEASVFIGISFYFTQIEVTEFWIIASLVDAILLSLYYYIVDISLALGISETKQTIGKLKFKGVHVKWGLMEPVIYGFVLFASCGLVKFQVIFVFLLALVGLTYQILKKALPPRSQKPQ